MQALRPILGGKARKMVEDKNASFFEVKSNQPAKDIASKRPFWIHAASGEIEYARPVIRELKNKYPQTPIIVTFSSPSAKKILKTLIDVDAWGALPWDFQKNCEQFLETWKPRCLLIARTDVWPVMAEACHQKGIPSLLFSATFASNSSRLKGLSAEVTRWALSQLSEIFCVSTEDVRQLDRLGLQVPVHVHGDTRFDQVFHRLAHPKVIKNELRPSKASPVLVAGSTWPEDEKVLLPAFAQVKTRCKMVLAPHEINEGHMQPLEAELKALGLTYCKYSKASSWQSEDVLIIDEIGVLAELYTWGDFAFVGGSFKKQVHSVMEPLAAGLPVIVGPFHHNNREALLFKEKTLIGQFVVTEVTDITAMKVELTKLIEKMPQGFSDSLRQELSQHRHSSQYVVEWCEKHL
ncbi:3-deoxy-D-manno-octulosonic acid transferase [Bdellovibrio sp. HCB337]|uniref:3-deoxy-D-manno-octulosonic acid transferase n=1 Tax=Bdellovibrio sp. HCB337 TaxID=3394358 RepID=UPI0039A4D2BE